MNGLSNIFARHDSFGMLIRSSLESWDEVVEQGYIIPNFDSDFLKVVIE